MQKTTHKFLFTPAQNMSEITDESVQLVVTSPPYPMIEMWDESFFSQNSVIKEIFEEGKFLNVFELMHQELNKVWKECFRVLAKGGIACVNIGDATRTLNKNFQLFSNHARIISGCLEIGFQNLPNIIWRKPTNAPNKFMGSGMLPPGAYVTLEHEFILIFRKGEKRSFTTKEVKDNRQKSAYFWEERNQWFSDLWQIRGTTQKLFDKKTRERSAAYPFEIPHRLINMFSAQNDTVLDPFLGTGTTTLAAIANGRNSIGIELEPDLEATIFENILGKEAVLNKIIEQRLAAHLEFVKTRKELKGVDAFKHENGYYDFPVITKQERNLILPKIKKVSMLDNEMEATYS